MSELVTIFKSSFIKDKLINEKAKKFFLDLLETEKYSKNNSMHISNRGGFQTRSFSYIYDSEIAKLIFINPIKNYLLNFYKRKNIIDFEINLQSYWLNKNNNSDYNVVHNHLPNNFSGVWYLKAPKNCGNLVFQNGDLTVLNEQNFDYFYDPHFFSRFYLEIQENDLILFPSHMLHYVEPNKSNKDRISLAFNITINPIYKESNNE